MAAQEDRPEDNVLFVNGIPGELNQNEVRKLFAVYGAITGWIASDSGKFAFISYSLYLEAEAAIRGLDGKPPLYMKVQFRQNQTDTSMNPVSQQNGHGNGIISNPVKPPAPRHRFNPPGPRNPLPPQNYSPSHYPPPLPPIPPAQMPPIPPAQMPPPQMPPMPPPQMPPLQMPQPHLMVPCGFYPYPPIDLPPFAAGNDLLPRGTIATNSAGHCYIPLQPHQNFDEQVARPPEVQRKNFRCPTCGRGMKKFKNHRSTSSTQNTAARLMLRKLKQSTDDKFSTERPTFQQATNSSVSPKSPTPVISEETIAGTISFTTSQEKIDEELVEELSEKVDKFKLDDIDIESSTIIYSVNVGEKIHIFFPQRIGDTTARGVLMTKAIRRNYNETYRDALKVECDKVAPMCNDYTPSINDYVCIKNSEDLYWSRGIILKTESPLTVALIDMGLLFQVPPVSKVIPIPKSLKKIPMLTVELKSSVKLNVSQNAYSIQISRCEMTDQTGPILLGNFINSNISVKIARWSPWKDSLLLIPAIEQPLTIPEPEIKNNSQVVLQCHRGLHEIYLRSLDPEEVERQNSLNEDVAKAAEIAENLTTPPVNGDYVLAQFIDGNFYRGWVQGADDTNTVLIDYIDYGYLQICKLEELKKFPVELLTRPKCIAGAMMNGIRRTSQKKEGLNYLTNLVETKEPLNCSYNESLMLGVRLSLVSTEEIVNDKVNDLITPSWDKKAKSGDTADKEQTYWMSDIETVKFGDIGEAVDAVLINVLKVGAKYVFAPYKKPLLREIKKMKSLIMEYCSKNAEAYIPKTGELCIALYRDGNWSRGCCVNPSAKHNFATIFFLDHGNFARVEYACLKKFTREFLQPPAVGIVCNVDLSMYYGEITAAMLERMEESMILNNVYRVMLKSVNEDLEYTIEILDIENALAKI